MAEIYKSKFPGQEIDERLELIPELQEGVEAAQQAADGKYTKPASGIPMTDLSDEVQEAIEEGGGQADWAQTDTTAPDYIKNKPSIPTHVVRFVQQFLSDSERIQARANIGAGTYTKPSGGIPESDLADDVIPDVSDFITNTVNNLVNYYLKSETYSRSEVQQLIAAIQGVSFVSVASLPTPSADTMGGKIYLVPSANPDEQNVKDEFITIQDGNTYTWEQIGSTAVNLSGYVTTQQLNNALAAYTTTEALTTLLAAKQDTISDLSAIRSGATAGATAYQKPQTGIPASDLAPGVIPTVPTDVVKYSSQSLTDAQKAQARTNIGAAAASALTALETAIAAKYTKPSSGIPETDLEANVRAALALARTSIQSLADYYDKTEIDSLLAAVSSEQYVDVATLPTASASTLGKIYLVGPTNGVYDRYYTSYDGTTYSWVGVGTTEINLANYATKEELNQLSQKVGASDETVNLASFTPSLGTIINAGGNWANSSTSKIIFIPIKDTSGSLSLKTTTKAAIIAFLKSDTVGATGSTAAFATGETGRRTIPEDSEVVFDSIPSDAAFLYLVVASSDGVDRRPTFTLKETYGLEPRVSELEEITGDLKNEVYDIDSRAYDYSGLTHYGWLIRDNGNWFDAEEHNLNDCVLIPITPGVKYKVVAKTTGQIIALLKSSTMVSDSSADFCAGYSGRITISSGNSVSFTAPSDAAFCYFQLLSSGNVRDADFMEPYPIEKRVATLEDAIGVDGEEKVDAFNTAPEYFTWEKMEQQTKLKWTPRSADIQKASSTTKFPANTEQVGMPYSSVWEYMKFVGTDVSFHTFMTALRNKYSLMYTECVRNDYSKSAYGRTYHGAANSGPFYGNTCSSLTSYALGSLPYTTKMFVELATRGILEVVYDQSANGVLRGDLLWQTGHVRMIKNVWRKNGVVTKVLVCEEVQPQAKDNAIMTATEFNTFIAQNSMIIYRYKDLYKNISYTPSPYVAVGDETPATVTYNDDICTFAGDKASFAEGELIYIHCLNLSYPQMEIYKDNVLLETITLATDARASKTSDDLAYAVNLSNDSLAYGMYKCRLKNGNTYSDYTYFEVVDTSVSADGAFSSTKGVAVLYFFTDSTGRAPAAMVAIDSRHSGTVDTSGADSERPILRIIFQGEYGRVFAQAQVI